MSQVAKLNGVIFREFNVFPVSNHLADPTMAGNSEILFGNCNFQFRQNIVIGFVGFDLVVTGDIIFRRYCASRDSSRQGEINDGLKGFHSSYFGAYFLILRKHGYHSFLSH